MKQSSISVSQLTISQLLSMVRGHHHAARVRLGCQVINFGSSRHEFPSACVYVHASLPWRYFNHFLLRDWDAANPEALVQESVDLMHKHGRVPSCEIETSENWGIGGTKHSKSEGEHLIMSQAPALVERSAFWTNHLQQVGYTAIDALTVMIHTLDPFPKTATNDGAWEVAPMPLSGLQTQVRLYREGFEITSNRSSEIDQSLILTNVRCGVEYLWVMDRQTGQPIGSTATLAIGPLLEIFALAVIPEYRNRGAGQMLVQASLQLARERGCTTVYLQMEPGARPGALYQRMGFEAYWRQMSFVYEEQAGYPVTG